MIVICEECGKKYRIDPTRIKGNSAKFKCKVCSHIISVSQTIGSPQEPPPPPFIEPEPDVTPVKKKFKRSFSFDFKKIGLRGKMIILFFILPILMMILMSWFYTYQLDNLTTLYKQKGLDVVTNLAEKTITSTARTTAEQVRYYLEKNPSLKRENFANNKDFMRIAVQKVGKTGYTALYALPDENGTWRTWAHANPKIHGIDMTGLKKPLGRNFAGFWKIFIGVKNGRESRGYYTWQDKDKSFRDKYMISTPVKGTTYIIAATTYLDEFTQPMNNLRNQIDSLVEDVRLFIFVMFAVSLAVAGIIVYWYSTRLSGRITHLTQVAERISIGEMEAEIQKDSGDEIGALGEAISRMQDSIRLSIERLRRRH